MINVSPPITIWRRGRYEVTTEGKKNLFRELTLASAASVFLGLGTLFLLLWTGVYVWGITMKEKYASILFLCQGENVLCPMSIITKFGRGDSLYKLYWVWAKGKDILCHFAKQWMAVDIITSRNIMPDSPVSNSSWLSRYLDTHLVLCAASLLRAYNFRLEWIYFLSNPVQNKTQTPDTLRPTLSVQPRLWK